MNARDPSYRPDWPEAEIELWSWALNTHPSWVEERRSEVVSKLAAAGFTIMAKEDVEAVRDKALEEAASKIETMLFTLSIGSPDDGPFTRQDKTRDEVCQQASAAIRSMKTGEKEQ